uniref:Uncharacterized protein n=1 Tax=Fagus sylvatica TaxID=28930 RepID=A0A2N9FK98_FAGSY
MGGGAVPLYVDLHRIQLKASSSNLPSIPTSNSSSASSSNNLNLPVSATFTGPLKTSSSETNCGRLESVDGREEKRASGSLYNLVFGHVPSQVFMLGKSSSGSELKWLEQKLDGFDPRLLLSQGYRRFCDAFQLLYTDPTIKDAGSIPYLAGPRLGIRPLARPIGAKVVPHHAQLGLIDYGRPQSSDEEPDLAANILRWILDATRTKVIELIEKFLSLVNELFQPPDKENPKEGNKEQMEEKVRSSLLLSVVIILIVVVARIPIA